MSPEIAIAVLLNRRPGTDGSCPFLVHLLIRFLGRTGPISELTCPPGRGILRTMDGAATEVDKTGPSKSCRMEGIVKDGWAVLDNH